MDTVKVLIVEDELLIAEGLKSLLAGMGYEVAAIFTSGAETMKCFRPGMADMVFMDIHLADKTSGIDVAMELKKISNIPIIYLTSSQDEYLRKKAIQETNAVHYLAKPFNRPGVCTAIDFALKSLRSYDFAGIKPNEEAYLLKDSIFLKNGLGHKKIMIADILFLKASGSYCEFTFREGKEKPQLFSENLSYYGEKLAFVKELVRIHRSYIVNANFIERVHENRLWVNGLELPISKSYRPEFIEKLRFV
ncbi:MAG TPA: response regulator transcription factor [Mucilaginibacter sp.]|nr:response regulator transcription factor [Mucilaginibacter sp.]